MSRSDVTRQRILESTRTLLEEAAGKPVSMGEIARSAGVTRQLLYIHFESRAQLLLEVSRHADVSARTPRREARIHDAPDAVTALREAVALQGYIKPKIHAVARAVDRLRATDADAAAVWEERESARLSRCADVVRRLDDEGVLAPSWSIPAAAAMFWSVTSLRAWEELVMDRGWSRRAWIAHTTRVVEGALVAPA